MSTIQNGAQVANVVDIAPHYRSYLDARVNCISLSVLHDDGTQTILRLDVETAEKLVKELAIVVKPARARMNQLTRRY